MAWLIVIQRKWLSCSSQVTLFQCISLWVYHGIFFTSSHFISQFPPTRFPLITAIRMCHFLPGHHLGMAFLAGSKTKIQHDDVSIQSVCFFTTGAPPWKRWGGVRITKLKSKVWFLWWHMDLRGLFNAKAILLEEQWWCYLTHSWEDKGVHTSHKGYLSESKRNSATGIRTRLLRFCCPSL